MVVKNTVVVGMKCIIATMVFYVLVAVWHS